MFSFCVVVPIIVIFSPSGYILRLLKLKLGKIQNTKWQKNDSTFFCTCAYSAYILFSYFFLSESFIAEVVEAKREELNKLKEQLLISFKDQMELR